MRKDDIMEIKDCIRPTQIVRSVMRQYGKPSYMIYTNRYEKCRTVKCYSRDSAHDLIMDIRQTLIKSGVNDFSIKTIPARVWGRMGSLQSLIVRIPYTEQP